MPRRLLPALLLFCAACSKQDSAAPAAPAGTGTLVIGSPAPPLTGAKWLRGEAVNPAEPGQVTVVEFWATWCGPCLDAMPHLATLAAKHKAAGLRVAAVTTTDRDNTAAAVEKYLAGRGKDLPLNFAACDTSDTMNAYMAASGRDALPASYVIDKAGKVAFIGHPDDLDDVLPKVLAGTWKGEPDAAALAAEEAELNAILGKIKEAATMAQYGGNPSAVGKAIQTAAEAAVPELDAYAAKYPARVNRPLFPLARAQVLMQANKWEAARTAAASALDLSAGRKNTALLGMVVGVWADRRMNPAKRYPELPVKAADELLKLTGGEEVQSLVLAAQAYLFAGELDKGRAFGKQAVDKVEDLQQQTGLRQRLKEMEW